MLFGPFGEEFPETSALCEDTRESKPEGWAITPLEEVLMVESVRVKNQLPTFAPEASPRKDARKPV